MDRVLIMGGSYFIGRKIAELCVNAGYDVSIVNRGTVPPPCKTIHQIQCDRNNIEDMKKALKNVSFDIVIDGSGRTKNQAEILCKSLNLSKLTHFVFISSAFVYDFGDFTIPFVESVCLAPNKDYPEYELNKIKAEKYLSDYFGQKDTKLIILRPPYVYGPNNHLQRESFVFDHILYENTIIMPKSHAKIQFIYVADLAHIVLHLLKERLDSVNVFNISNKQAVTFKEWIEYCFKACEKPVEIIEYDYKKDKRDIRDFFPFFDRNSLLDVSKIKAIIPHETDFVEGLANAYQWFLKERNTIRFNDTIRKNELEILNSIKHSESVYKIIDM